MVAGKVLAPKYKEENAKYIDQLKYEMDGAEEAYKREFDRYAKNYGSKLAEQQKSVQELRAVADSKTRIYHDNTTLNFPVSLVKYESCPQRICNPLIVASNP